ncbi:MAG TPA: hypothetical protein PKE63_05225 [Lacibacter sp.]|nr:hypothetical protein [Lacibacter sp.]HMO89123.1 hypothetical protein [Lacibacter sp.]HMP86656.1 hypothetical protein [Lacibacter sp.]
MKKVLLLMAIVLFTATSGHAQAAKSVFLELGGPGLASINFDTRFTNKQDGIGARVGIGGFSFNYNLGTSGRSSVVFIPLGLNYLLGKNTANFFELGAGYTQVITSNRTSSGSENFRSSFGHLNFGYRYQPKESGVTFRVAINPVFGNFGFIPTYGGVSVGYKF